MFQLMAVFPMALTMSFMAMFSSIFIAVVSVVSVSIISMSIVPVPVIAVPIITMPFVMMRVLRICIVSFFAAVAYHLLIVLPTVSRILIPIPVMAHPGIRFIYHDFMCTIQIKAPVLRR